MQANRFVQESARYLRDVYCPRLARALETLPNDDLWWRPHAGVISFGTILLHLEGNVRQWILSGVGGAADARDRAAEFAAQDGPSGPELLQRLKATVEAAATVIESLDEAALAREHQIQGYDVSAADAIYHVVEHFSWHVGQAAWIAKARAGVDHGLAYFDDQQINAARNAN